MLRFAAVLGGVCLALAACDDGPGVPDPFAPPPTLSEFTFTPLQFALADDAPTAEIPLALSVRVTNAGGSPDVRYFVRPEFGTETIADGVLTGTAGGRFTANTTLSVPRGETGVYVVTVTVSSADGRVGNLVTGLLEFTAESLGPPVIEGVAYPEIVQRPTGPTCELGNPNNPAPTLVPIVATVTDPDGLQNVNRVVLRTQGGAELPLLDDGSVGSGDETAGDGRFTITLQVECFNEPGPNDFTLRAFDRAGQASEPVAITITIE